MDKQSGSVTTPGPMDLDEYEVYVDGLMDKLELTRFVVQKILVPIVVILGVTVNVLNIAVLTQR